MYSLSMIKFSIPTLKNKLIPVIQTHLGAPAHLPHTPPSLFSEFHPNQYPSSIAAFNEAIVKGPADEPEEKAADEEETCKSTCSFPQSDHNLQKNIIDNRVKSLQYEANNPCEDTLACDQLKHVQAYAISVFDGHGGPELAEYCRSKIHSFIDTYLFERLSSFETVGEAIKESLKASYLRLEETFFDTYEQQLKLGNKRIRSVGTCAITAVVHNDFVYLANAGDSQAVFLVSDEKGIKSVKGNDRLSVNSRSERERLKKEWMDRDE
jgi:pyruvate dehydrogenase phosphatase